MKLRNLKGYLKAAQSPALVQAEIAALLYPKSFRIGTSIFNSILYGVMLTYLMPGWLPVADGPFRLVLRTYQPRPEILNQNYKLPPIAIAG